MFIPDPDLVFLLIPDSESRIQRSKRLRICNTDVMQMKDETDETIAIYDQHFLFAMLPQGLLPHCSQGPLGCTHGREATRLPLLRRPLYTSRHHEQAHQEQLLAQPGQERHLTCGQLTGSGF